MAVKNIRDLLVGDPHPDEANTLQKLAAPQEYEQYPVTNPERIARMPGDDIEKAPYYKECLNPLPGLSVQAMSKLLREGRLPPEKERAVRTYLGHYQKLSGEVMYDHRNHNNIAPTEQEHWEEGKKMPRADNFDSGRNYSWGGHRVR